MYCQRCDASAARGGEFGNVRRRMLTDARAHVNEVIVGIDAMEGATTSVGNFALLTSSEYQSPREISRTPEVHHVWPADAQ